MLQLFQPLCDLKFHCMMATEIFFHAQCVGRKMWTPPTTLVLLAVIILLYSQKFSTDDIN